MRAARLAAATSLAAILTLSVIAHAQTGPAVSPEEVLYEDAAALSSATVTQILPNANKETLNVDHLRRVRMKGDVLILEWGTTAVTLLPKQFVGSMTINRRIDPAAGAPAGTSAPGGGAAAPSGNIGTTAGSKAAVAPSSGR
jgi:hypothetical protein